MTLDQLLASIGANVASSAIYELVTRHHRGSVDDLRSSLESSLNVVNARVAADRVIEFLAKTGDITISGSLLSASDQITMASAPRTKVSFGDGSVSKTDTTRIEAGRGARIEMQGGAKIVQNPDGSIHFYT
jgi:hypothetical protein